MATMTFSHVFPWVCVKVWNPYDIPSLQKKCGNYIFFDQEKEFPLAFFDIMTHLLLHVVDELDVCGPIHNRWMYPMEWMIRF